jgi:isoquinoline 1-oxidoreductase subunit beta
MARRRFTRRRFLIAGGAAAGLVVAYGAYRAGSAGRGVAGTSDAAGANLNDWVHVGSDGTVTVRCGRSEMGQGAFTGIGTLVAEELDCAWNQVRVETGPVAPSFANVAVGQDLLESNSGFAKAEHGWVTTKIAETVAQQITGGSSSIVDSFERAREAGAVARAMLVAAAAASWGVDPASCETHDSMVSHSASQRQTTYGELASAAVHVKPPAHVALKSRSAWRLIGHALQRVDIPAKVDGSAQYGIDVRRPNMVFAAVANCPVFGGKLKAFDAGAASKLPGFVGAHPVPGGVAVAADSTWRARQALAALAVDWDQGSDAALDSAEIERRLAAALDGKLKKAWAKGDVAAALAGAAKTLSATYRLPYLAHATMEPMNCTAEVTADGIEVWAPTQAQTTSVEAAAKAAGVAQDKVRLHTTLLGGGFGRRIETDLVSQAVTLAKLLKRPVQANWSREEDIRHDFYRPAALVRLDAALDASGAPMGLRQQIASQSIMARVFPPLTWIGPDPTMLQGAPDLPYAIAHQRVELAVVELPVPVASWRSVGHSITAFAKESFIDEMAHEAGADPLDYRLALLKHQPRLARILSLAAEKAGWKAPLGAGEGRGIALHGSFLSAVAQVVEVAVDGKGALSVKRVVAAVDCGTVVNPDIVKAQVESGVIFGLSAALFGRISIKEGRVVEENFPDYDMVHLAQAPNIEVYIVPSEEPPGGIGEPGLPPLAPALANAIFAATGRRIRSLPVTGEGFSA